MENPFLPITKELKEVKNLLHELLRKPKEDLSNKLYTVKEAADLFKVDEQTVRNKIKRGEIKATKFGGLTRIYHYEIFNSLEEVKSIKYKR